MRTPGSLSNPRFSALWAMLLLCAGLLIGWQAMVFFDDVGPWWRGRVQDSFVATPAQIDTVHTVRVEDVKHRLVGRPIIVTGHYAVSSDASGAMANADYPISGQIEMVTGYGEALAAAARVAELRRTLRVMTVYYDPANPRYAVLYKTALPGGFRVALMGVLGVIVLLMALALAAMGLAGLTACWPARWLRAVWRFVPHRAARFSAHRHLSRPAPNPGTVTPVPRPPKPPRIALPLTGDDLADYYSGALSDHAVGRWPGFWCDVFLMPHNKVVLAHQGDKGYYIRVWHPDEVLSGRAGLVFDDNQQAERAMFEQAVQKRHD